VVAVVGAHFVPGIITPVPLVDHFLDAVFTAIQTKQRRPFLRPVPGITLNLQLHTEDSTPTYAHVGTHPLVRPAKRSEPSRKLPLDVPAAASAQLVSTNTRQLGCFP
jgi:hypothetical protein